MDITFQKSLTKTAKFFFFKQKTAYELESRDWSSDVCSSDLTGVQTCALPIDRKSVV